MEERSLGFEIKLLNNLITRRIIKDSKEYNGFSVSQVQMKIIHYLIDHIDKPIYQRDIEKNLMVRRPTASGILNTMEKNGFIKRVSSKEDARLKQIIICDKTLDLAKHFKTWGDFRKAVEDDYDFTTLPNFGEGMSYSILHFDFTEIDDAVVYGIHCQEYVEEITSNSLDGITFVITGKLTSFKNRDELKSIIESKGGKVAGAVSKNTKYLINNDNTSTSAKNVSAQKLGIPIITEAEFKKIFDI